MLRCTCVQKSCDCRSRCVRVGCKVQAEARVSECMRTSVYRMHTWPRCVGARGVNTAGAAHKNIESREAELRPRVY